MNNERYNKMVLQEGEYYPETGLNYPVDDPVARMYAPKYTRNDVFDENYPYFDESRKANRAHRLGYFFILHCALFPINRLKYGIRVEGRENLKKYKEQLKGGAITISNHCYRYDCPAILDAVGMDYHTKIPMFAPNFNTKDHNFLVWVGGIPLPETLSAMKKFNAAFDEFHKLGYWFHVFPEAARWNFYKPLRPFQKGAFTWSYKYDMPILPCVITYRERKGIYRLFGKKTEPLLTVKIGEPLFPDRTRPRKEEVDRLRETAHLTMQRMAGIIENPWPIVPENEK